MSGEKQPARQQSNGASAPDVEVPSSGGIGETGVEPGKGVLQKVLHLSAVILKWVVIAALITLAAALVTVSFLWSSTHWAISLLLAIAWAGSLSLLVLGVRRYRSGRAVLARAMSFLLVCGLALFALLWSVGSNFRLANISQQLMAGKADQRVIAFVDVNLVPMDSERIVPHQTVIVRDGRIAAVGPTDTTIAPAGAMVVDGRGKYLTPGLIDAHAHILVNLDDPLLYVANGVTAVRSMSSYAPAAGLVVPNLPYRSHFDLRDKIARGELVGPTLYLEPGPIEDAASPFVRGHDFTVRLLAPIYRIVASPSDAVRQVDEVQREGFDSVKVYSYLRGDEYEAVAAEAKERGLKLIGHVPRSIPVDSILAGGQWEGQWQTIEHLSGYMHPCGGLKFPAGEMERYAKLTAQSGVWNVPTLVAFANVPPPQPPELRASIARRQEVRFVSPWMQDVWKGEYRPFDQICVESSPPRYPSQNLPEMQALVRALHDAGAGVALGSDSGAPYIVPGFSIHEELRLLAEAGFSPYEALRAGTYNAASALGDLAAMGTIAIGKRADLLLLEGNPMDDLDNVQHRTGVMARGHWFTEAELQGALVQLAATYR